MNIFACKFSDLLSMEKVGPNRRKVFGWLGSESFTARVL